MGNILRKISIFKMKRIVNNFLSKKLYVNELKFKRPTAEVERITSAVKTLMEKLTTFVANEETLCEISQTYLVGSMAEGTRIGEPDEFDFLVVLKHFSEPEAIYLREVGVLIGQNKWLVINNKIPLKLFGSSNYFSVDNDETLSFNKRFLTTVLSDVISKTEPVVTSHGTLSLQSTTVCHHGPASVIKLKWKPSSDLSPPLDILVDITPCIEQQGIDSVIKANDVDIPAHYEALVRDDMYMLTPSVQRLFSLSFTKTEVKIVKTLSPHHKMCYMILKYCLNNIIHVSGEEGSMLSQYPSYCIKTFVLRHVDRCKGGECLLTCILDTFVDMESQCRIGHVHGIFGQYMTPFDTELSLGCFNKIMVTLFQIGKNGYSVERHEQFRNACWHFKSPNSCIKECEDDLESNNGVCHLCKTCTIHN